MRDLSCWPSSKDIDHNSSNSLKAHNRAVTEEPKPSSSKPYHDLTLAPKIGKFYDRTTELNTLSHWLCDQHIPLVSVVGIAGIGKTSLVKRWIDLNSDKFETIVWKSIKFSPTLDTIIEDILTAVNPDAILTYPLFSQFFQVLRDRKCLIILDDFQENFIPGQLAGQYQPASEDYQTLLAKIVELGHQSTVLVMSREKSQQMVAIDALRVSWSHLGSFDFRMSCPTSFLNIHFI